MVRMVLMVYLARTDPREPKVTKEREVNLDHEDLT